MTEFAGLESELHIASINCRVKLADIYNRVNFDVVNETNDDLEDPETQTLDGSDS